MDREKRPLKLCKNKRCLEKARKNSDYCSDWCKKADTWGVKLANKLKPELRKYYQPCRCRFGG